MKTIIAILIAVPLAILAAFVWTGICLLSAVGGEGGLSYKKPCKLIGNVTKMDKPNRM